MKRLTIFFVLWWCSHLLFAQVKGETYTVEKLSQESVRVLSSPVPAEPIEKGDTSFTKFTGASVEIRQYFVNGDKYDNVFNPNPTGVFINGQHFLFYCEMEMSVRQSVNMLLDIKEFEFLGKRYIMMLNFRENCVGAGCRYRCYNLFDVTDPKKVVQLSFSSFYEGMASFGEFNNDGVLDFLRIAPKPPQGQPASEDTNYYLISAYSVVNGKPVQLKSKNNNYHYLYVRGEEGDEEIKHFEILKADWFFSVKDTSGKAAEATSMSVDYISFDPRYRNLYEPSGILVEKNNFALHVIDVQDLEAAQDYCQRLADQGFEHTYIMVDQYSGAIKYQVLIGNFVNKEAAIQQQKLLAQTGTKGRVMDFKTEY